MKKILMLLFVGLATIGCSKDETPEPTPAPAANAMKLYNSATDAEIHDGDVILFSGTPGITDPTNVLKFYFKNTSAAPINVRSRVISFSGVANGDNVQYCIGQNCLASISEGTNYPISNQEVLTVPANGILGKTELYKLQNFATPVAPATKVDYVIEFYQYDSNLNETNTIRITYRYEQ